MSGQVAARAPVCLSRTKRLTRSGSFHSDGQQSSVSATADQSRASSRRLLVKSTIASAKKQIVTVACHPK
jgi:hypothetical protein